MVEIVILCGGQGTRLREQTEFLPKPMLDIGGRPILWHIMKGYAQHRFNRFVLCLGYKGNLIKEYFLNYGAMNNDFTVKLGDASPIVHHGNHDESGYTVTLANTGLDAMTGARVKRVARYVTGDCFMVTYGDGLSDVDLSALYRFHQSHGRLATITAVRPRSRFGIVEFESDGAVTHFAEKPALDGWVSAGFMVFHRAVFDYLTDNDACILEREPLERLAQEGQLMAFRHDGFFYAMDTYREYLNLNKMWNDGQAPWRTW